MPTNAERTIRSAVPLLRSREAAVRQDVGAAGHRADRCSAIKESEAMRNLRVQICAGLLLAATASSARTGAARTASADRRRDACHRRQLHPRRDRTWYFTGLVSAGRLRQVLPPPRADADRQPHRPAPQPRHALFDGRVRPRCRAGDDHAARCGQALHVDDRDRRGPLRVHGRLRRRQPHLHQGADRHALRRWRRSASWSIRAIRRTWRRSTPCRTRSRSSSRAAQADSRCRTGIGEPEEGARCAGGAGRDHP